MDKNIPQIRFRGFEEEWEETKFGKKLLSMPYKEYIRQPEPNGMYPIIQQGDESIVGYANGEPIQQYDDKVIFGDHTVSVYKPDRPFFVATDGLRIFSVKDFPQSLLYALFERYKPASHGYTRHTSYLNDSKISFPNSLPEQQKIGEFFKTLDELIAAKQDELKKLQQLKAALLEQMFPCEEGTETTDGGGTSQVIDALNRLHTLNHTAPDLTLSHAPNTPRIRFKGFTDEWEKKTIDELFILRNGYTPSKANPEYWTDGTIPWFRMDDIREQGHILKDASQHVTPQAVKGSGLFPAGCIIMSTTATIGEHALLIADSLANQQFTVFQTVNRWKTIDMMFFYHYCFILGEWCRRNVNVGGLNAVNISDLRQYKIPFPSMEEQKLIAGVMTAQEEKIKAAKQQIQKLQTIKQAMLQKMFVA